jgi:hypothetical protein
MLMRAHHVPYRKQNKASPLSPLPLLRSVLILSPSTLMSSKWPLSPLSAVRVYSYIRVIYRTRSYPPYLEDVSSTPQIRGTSAVLIWSP